MRCFIDSNILIYLRDRRALEKTERSTEWIRELAGREAVVVSPQVINEFTSVLTQKLKMFSYADVALMAAEMRRWCTAPLDFETSMLAFEIRERFGLAWWDSLIASSALQDGCDILLSEDMNHDQRIGPMRIVNPFLVRPDEVLSPV